MILLQLLIEGDSMNNRYFFIFLYALHLQSIALRGSPEQSSSGLDIIETFSVKNNRIDITVNQAFKKKFLKDNFWAVYDEGLDLSELDASILVLPFIANVISIIWISGNTYTIESMDQDFYESLKIVKEVFSRMYPETKWHGELIPRKLIRNTVTPKFHAKDHIALLFSGGLDSITSSLYHREKKQLLITVNGHWDLPLWDKKLLKERKRDLVAFGTHYGHENSFINSNYYDFLNRQVLDTYSHEIASWRIFCVEGIGWAGLAAPLMALKGYTTLLHASTISWDFNFPACANPFIDDNITFCSMHLQHDLFDMNRLNKCEYIGDLCKRKLITPPFIRVCEEKTVRNCCACQKCIRTILELVVAEEDPQAYGFTRDIDKVLTNSQKFLDQHGTGATTVWHFMHIQKRLQEKIARKEPIPPSLEWLLYANLKKKLTSEIKNQRRLDWRDFVDVLPSIQVPESLDLAF